MSSELKDKGKFDGRIALLKLFAEFINPSEVSEISVTLNVHGTVVSGTMIGSKRYYHEVGEMFVDAIKTKSLEETSGTKEEFKMLFQMLKQPPTAEQLEGGEVEVEYNHIFLKDARIYDAAHVFSATYWVGKIESVDGFFLGIEAET